MKNRRKNLFIILRNIDQVRLSGQPPILALPFSASTEHSISYESMYVFSN